MLSFRGSFRNRESSDSIQTGNSLRLGCDASNDENQYRFYFFLAKNRQQIFWPFLILSDLCSFHFLAKSMQRNHLESKAGGIVQA